MNKMRRIAIFVEGYTELVFLDKLICEIAEAHQIAIHHRQIRGGGTKSGFAKHYIELQTPPTIEEKSLYFLLIDCGGDQQVSQRIREEHSNLTKSGYERIIGLRDVYPQFSHADIPKLKVGLRYGIKTSLAPVNFILSVMEIEAWFLAEYKHLTNISTSLTPSYISSKLGFDPSIDDMTLRPAPATDLTNVYDLAGIAYTKGSANQTVNHLDFENLYISLPDRIAELRSLIEEIDSFISPQARQ